MRKRNMMTGIGLFAAFLIWTAAACVMDVQPIGPDESAVGFAALNRLVHRLTGVHMSLYTITDWLGLVPVSFAAGFGVLGLAQWIRRKSLFKVDRDILVLGGFYVIVMTAYLFFEVIVINYRPILIEGRLEASYPSSTTLLTLCVMPTAIMQLNARLKYKLVKCCIAFLIAAFTILMVAARLISGVHWFTDIIGGILLSAALVTLYCSCAGR